MIRLVLLSFATLASAYISSGPHFSYDVMVPPLDIYEERAHEKRNKWTRKPLAVTYTNNAHILEDWLYANNVVNGGQESSSILGFDMESVPQGQFFRHVKFEGVATIQLATTTSSIVVQLARADNYKKSLECASIIKSILMDKNIVKVGVGIDDDILDLYQEWGRLEAVNRLDLSKRLTLADTTPGNRIGIKKLAQHVLNVDLPKTKRVQRSNWSLLPLRSDQVAYAARDAWVSAAVVSQYSNLFKDLATVVEDEVSIAKLYRTRMISRDAKKVIKDLNLVRDSRDLTTSEVFRYRAAKSTIAKLKVSKQDDYILV